MQSWSHVAALVLMLVNIVSGLSTKLDPKAEESCEYTAPWQTLPELPPMPKANFEGTAPIDGIDLWYATFGAPLEESKAKGLNPVVFLHGGFANSDYWANQINHLKDHQYTLISIDSRAQGRSSDDTSRPLTYDLMTEDVIGLMDHLGIEKFSTIGWSDGSCISFDLAMNFTSRLDRSFTFGGTYSPENINATAAESTVFLKYMKRVQEEYEKNSPSKGTFHEFEEGMNTMWGSLPDWDAKSFAKIPTRYSDPNAPIMWIVDGDSEEAVTRSTPGEIHSWVSQSLLTFLLLLMVCQIWGSDPVILPGVSHFA
jgi:pimeloyl-ACP methyl ester carboxylesterase